MKKYFIVVGIFLITQATVAAPLTAIMTFESMTMTADGVQKKTHFQERFIRDTNVVWSERIIPKSVQHHDHDHEENSNSQEKHDHKHNLNFATAGKWLVRDASNKISFRFVRKEDKKIIAPRESEYGTLGFDGVWETAYYMANRNTLKKMTILKKAAPTGAIWYEKKNTHEFTRILWDEKNEIPLSIESGTLDGNSNNKITLVITPAPSPLPWSTLASYSTIAYEDLLD
jgi:hypothetical protein